MDVETVQSTILQQEAFRLEFDEVKRNCIESLSKNLNVSYYTTRLDELQTLYEKFKRNHYALLVGADRSSTTNYSLINNFLEYENLFIEVKAKLKEKIEASTPQQSHPPTDPNTRSELTNIVIPTFKPHMNLPHIQLPKFNGDYKSWRTFRDLFRSIIHNSENIPNVHKMHYLKSCVSGEAERLLKQFDVTESNYAQAWSVLEKRFENNKRIINMLLAQLFKSPSVKSETAQAIKNLIDTTEESLHELQTLRICTENWDPILIYLLVQKLPPETHELWEQEQGAKIELPSYAELIKFLEARFRVLESLESSSSTKNKVFLNHTNKSNTNQIYCTRCRGDHNLYQCQKFKDLSTNEKLNFVKTNKLCHNCLSKLHTTIDCRSKYSCKHCNRKHHSLLHIYKNTYQKPNLSTLNPHNQERTKSDASTKVDHQNAEASQAKNFLSSNFKHALLSTALVLIYNDKGHYQKLRALIDSGSQVSFITASAAKRLQLKFTKTFQQISGLEKSNTTMANSKTTCKLKSINSNYETELNALVIKSITNWLPGQPIDNTQYEFIKTIKLADPTFHIPGCIDILLGADIFAKIIKNGVIKHKNCPTAQNTELGWILMGAIEGTAPTIETFFTESTSILEQNIRQFWECEEEIVTKPVKPDDQKCESIYKNTTIRLPDGRYQVDLPFKNESGPDLGHTRHKAITQFFALEKKFGKDSEYHKLYSASINEYLTLGQMKEVPPPKPDQLTYYLPHHGVIKESSTTKLRPVFNASCISSNGRSLNEQMFVGPTIQPTLYTTLLRFRLFKYAMTADIEKMYRMILINPRHYDFQRIIWRNSSSEPLKDYALTTVTFGTSSAPFLAIRTIFQLADDEGQSFPKAAAILKNNLYVDDLVCSIDTLENAKIAQKQLLEILRKGGFHLRKWSANHHDLLKNVPEEDKEIKGSLNLCHGLNLKILGIKWSPASDEFTFEVKSPESKTKFTKRLILSEIASLFDPFGWIAPCIMIAKIIMQQLWMSGCNWDSEPPQNIIEKWVTFRQNLAQISTIKIPRWIKYEPEQNQISLHGFCDASISGYAAAIYIKVTDHETSSISLLTAKTKVAPIKPVSLPRLELCAAVLLSRISKIVRSELELNTCPAFHWTDSLITLSWIQGHANKWKTYVANRVAEIQENTKPSSWRHVPGKENPADCASRGQMPTEMLENKSWWSAPSWMYSNENYWPKQPTKLETNEELKKPKVFTNIIEPDFISKFSTYLKLLRVTAYCLRFFNNAAFKIRSKTKMTQYLTVNEINSAEVKILQIVQNLYFHQEISNLKNSKCIHKKSKLLTLNPFLDETNLLRVGGRLTNSNLSYSQKHPIILPNNHHVTKLLIQYIHKHTLHGGTQLVLNIIRNKFWILGAKNTVKYQIRQCVTCFRASPKISEQMMKDLPQVRVTQSLPFQHTGIDFAGPFHMKTSKIRNAKTVNVYLCLYICLATKAIHLELVTDMTAEAFIASFRRFTSRRGLCTDIYSDCGTNFIKANKLMFSKELQANVANKLSNDKVTWHFNPPSAPHFGGLWESGIKLVKTHLNKTLNQNKFTFEELSTLLCQIEANVNSRPYIPVNMDTENGDILTPGHLVIGRNIKTLPETINLDNIAPTRRWQHLQYLNKQFWSKWSTEYLVQQQQRHKWQIPKQNLKVGDIVLVKNEQLPPPQWPLGKIHEIHIGDDKLVRTVTVKIGNKLFLRPTVKICKLPMESET